ncbi:MAG TPA: hypothetical protein VNM14_08350 [Planctomycetota bacterium]|nr:hypothetical protein [Planctomycetota bacterium]
MNALLMAVASCTIPTPPQDLPRDLGSSTGRNVEDSDSLPTCLADELGERNCSRTAGDVYEDFPLLPVHMGIIDFFERPTRPPYFVLELSTTEYHAEIPEVPEKRADYGLYASPIK